MVILRPRKALKILAGCIALLATAHLVGQAVLVWSGHDFAWGFVPLFNLDGERNVPTWYSSCMLLAAGGLLLLIGAEERRARRPFSGRWRSLGLLFVLLSADEAAGVHERLTGPIRRALLANDLFYGGFHFAWVLPALLLLLALVWIYLRWFLALPRPTRRLAGCSAALYLSGAIALEIAGGWLYSQEGRTVIYRLIVTVEELLEMAGVALWIYALVRYAGERGYGLRLELGSRAMQEEVAPGGAAAELSRNGLRNYLRARSGEPNQNVKRGRRR